MFKIVEDLDLLQKSIRWHTKSYYEHKLEQTFYLLIFLSQLNSTNVVALGHLITLKPSRTDDDDDYNQFQTYHVLWYMTNFLK